MKDYNSITFKNKAIDRLTVETTKPRVLPQAKPVRSMEEMRAEDLRNTVEVINKKKEEALKRNIRKKQL